MKFTPEKGYHKFQYAKKITREEWEGILPEEYWTYRYKWENNPLNFIVEDYPLHIGVEITTYCNLKCTFCIRTQRIKDGTFRDIKHMPFGLFKQIVDESKQYNLYGFCLNGIGEPLMHPDLIKMIRYAKSEGQMLDIFFHTNGTLLSSELSEAIVKSGLDQMIFSIDGSGSEEYETQRIGAKYGEVEMNVERFYEIRSRLGKRLPLIRVTMIVNPDTPMESQQRFINKWHKVADVLTFQELGIYGNSHGRNFRSISNPDFVCTQPWQRLAIDVDGQILPCCGALDYKNQLVIGRVGENKIYDVWHGKMLTKLREIHKNHRYFENRLCAKCILSQVLV
jgi:radical SAM protein with 4Fe4S-binding SPASM domain